MKKALPYLAIILATAIGGSSGAVIKSLEFSALGMSGLRMGVPFLVLLPVMLGRGKALGGSGPRGRLVLVSLLNAARSVLYIISFKFVPIAIAVTLLYLWPVFALIFNCIAERRRPGIVEFGVLLAAFIGVGVINYQPGVTLDASMLVGSLAMVASAAVYSVTALMYKSILKGYDEIETVYFQNAAGGLIFVGFLFREIPSVPGPDILLGIVYGLSVGIGVFTLIFWALKRISVFQYSALSYMEVVFGLMFGFLIMHETVNDLQMTGIIIVLFSSIFARFIEKRAP